MNLQGVSGILLLKTKDSTKVNSIFSEYTYTYIGTSLPIQRNGKIGSKACDGNQERIFNRSNRLKKETI